MFVGGGNTPRLVRKMTTFGNLKELFEGKVIAGSSAGAYFLTKHYFENDDSKLYDGLGILEIKALCHFSKKNEGAIKKLDEYGEKLPIIILPDHKWVVIFQ